MRVKGCGNMRVDRLLSILLIISNRGKVTGKELAEHFEVSLRTIYRDIEKIGEAGIPIASTGGVGGGFYIMDNYNLDKLFLNKGEFNTLMSVMNSLSFMFGKNEKFNDIVLKFENSHDIGKTNNERFSINMSHFSMENELKEYLYMMNKAIEESRLLIFDYINRNMEYSERIIEPIQISYSSGQWYVTAFCRTRGDFRRFKLVRIRNIRIGEYFLKREVSNEELDRIFNEGYVKRSIRVKLKFTDKIGEQLSEYFGRENIKKTNDNSYMVEESFPYEEGLIKFILGFGKECEVIEPDYLRKETKEYLHDVMAKYKD